MRSASIAICLPGIESRVKRAVTSDTRVAPLVITTKLMMVRMANTTRPTAKLPPITNSPKASITLPAAPAPSWPCSRITRLEAMFSARRSKVASSTTVGNAANSSGRITYTTASKITSDSAILKLKRISSTNGGSGSISIASMASITTGAPMPRRVTCLKVSRALAVAIKVALVGYSLVGFSGGRAGRLLG